MTHGDTMCILQSSYFVVAAELRIGEVWQQ